MACANMYNPEHHQHQPAPFMAPRMSFSSDFAVEPPPPAAARGGAAAPGDADFEFSVGSHPMMAADQLFSKGRILPLREAARGAPTTLRDELRAHDAADRGAARRGPRWKELLGLKRAQRKGAASAADAHVVTLRSTLAS